MGVGVLLLGIKFLGYYLTHSTAILSDALESIVNVVTALMALYAIRLSARPADKSHPYGHGKVEFFSSGIEGLLIAVAGAMIVFKAVEGLITKPEVTRLTTGLLLVIAAGVVNGVLGWYLIRKGRSAKSVTLTASGRHVMSDAYTSLGVIVGLALVKMTGIWWFDPLTALLVGIQIGYHGIQLVNHSVNRLMDAAETQTLDKIQQLLSDHRKQEWIAPHRLRAWRSGADLYVDLHLIMPYYWTLRETHSAEHELHEIINSAFDEPVELIVHIEPCMPECCHLCSMEGCPVRQHEQTVKHEWNRTLLTGELNSQVDLKLHPEDPGVHGRTPG